MVTYNAIFIEHLADEIRPVLSDVFDILFDVFNAHRLIADKAVQALFGLGQISLRNGRVILNAVV